MVEYIELCDLENTKDAKKVYSFMYHSLSIGGKKGKDPEINYLYFKYHGTEEEITKAKEDLDAFYEKQNEVANKLERQLENFPIKVKKIKNYFYFLGVEHFVEIKRKENIAKSG